MAMELGLPKAVCFQCQVVDVVSSTYILCSCNEQRLQQLFERLLSVKGCRKDELLAYRKMRDG